MLKDTQTKELIRKKDFQYYISKRIYTIKGNEGEIKFESFKENLQEVAKK